MFQYISEIIKNISPRQRFFALVVVLLTILLITLGGKIINAFTNSDKILENKVSRLEEANVLLNNQNRELQTILIQSQIQCTKDITQVREDILKEIGQIEREMRMTQTRMISTSRDTVQVIPVVTSNPAMNHLKTMKKKLEDEIENSK
jgi:predicted RND superfamily exporter protein